MLVVALVITFMVGGVYYFGLYMNMIISINMSFCLGVAVDYSTHIAHTFQMVKAPEDIKSANGQRTYKARKAISLMGSSVFHGGFSTFLAISVLYKARLYSIYIFFRVWVCIIGFGLLSGIILLPIILSFCGPLDYRAEKILPEDENVNEESDIIPDLTPASESEDAPKYCSNQDIKDRVHTEVEMVDQRSTGKIPTPVTHFDPM